MPLTPDDVSNKRFTPVRLREGYDMGEVDQFLDEIESELTRLLSENDNLRSGATPKDAVPAGSPETPATTPGKRTDKKADKKAGAEQTAAPAASGEESPEATTGADTVSAPRAEETITVRTAPEASNAAARLLEMATRNADELVEEARGEAETIVGTARTEAEQLEADTKERAESLEGEARQRSQMLDQETAERRQQMFSELEEERDRLNTVVEDLRAFEREYRARLKSYFTQQLQALDGIDIATDAGDPVGDESSQEGGGSNLKSVLGDD